MTLTLCSLFTGYGGLERGISLAFNEPIVTRYISDIEPGPQMLEQVRFPDATQLGDITQVDFSQLDRCDIVAGGSPCTDISIAGKQQGMFAGTRSGLWSFQADAIGSMHPKYVVWENVAAAVSAPAATRFSDPHIPVSMRALGRVLLDLYSLGYDAKWVTLTAAQAGAPHHRARIFLLATPREANQPTQHPDAGFQVAYADTDTDMWVSATPSLFDSWYTSPLPPSGVMIDGCLYRQTFSLPKPSEGEKLPTPTSSDTGIGATNSSDWKEGFRNPKGLPRALRLLCARVRPDGKEVSSLPVLQLLPTPRVRDTKGSGFPNMLPSAILGLDGLNFYRAALERWVQVLGRDYPAPLLIADRAARIADNPTLSNPAWLRKRAFTPRWITVDEPIRERLFKRGLRFIDNSVVCHPAFQGAFDKPFHQVPPVAVTDLWRERISGLPVVLAKENPEFVEWMMGLPAGWVTDRSLYSERWYYYTIRMLGNGVVPQQAALALSVLN